MKLCVHDTSKLDAPHPNEFNDLEVYINSINLLHIKTLSYTIRDYLRNSRTKFVEFGRVHRNLRKPYYNWSKLNTF